MRRSVYVEKDIKKIENISVSWRSKIYFWSEGKWICGEIHNKENKGLSVGECDKRTVGKINLKKPEDVSLAWE